MALPVSSIISLACQEANAPNYTVQAGQRLNMILQELAQDYDIAQSQGWLTGTFQQAPSFTGTATGNVSGSTITFTSSVLTLGWRQGMSITDSTGVLPQNTAIGLITNFGKTVTLTQSASAASNGDTFTVTQGGIGGTVNSANVVNPSGPFQLPADFLRMDFQDFFWQNGGINYFPTPLPIEEFDALVQQPGFTSYPTAYTIDTSTTPYGLYIWPAASAAYPYFGRYERQMADIDTPATSAVIPWFPNQQYLMRRLAAEIMGLTGDTRRQAYIAESETILRKFLQREGNRDTYAVKVKLNPMHFGPSWQQLPGTKVVPW